MFFKLIEEKNQLKEEAEKDFKKLESKIYDLHNEVEEYEEENLIFTKYEEGFKWVAIWEKSERYGGAEEGGWWFNHLRLVKAFHVPEEAIKSVEKWFDNHPFYSKKFTKRYICYGYFEERWIIISTRYLHGKNSHWVWTS